MPKLRALTPDQARRTIAARLGPRVDKLRQIATNLGVRPYRVFMVWSRFTGRERGEGHEQLIARVEILPTPKVQITQRATPYSAGVLVDGDLQLTRVSPQLTFDQLTGRMIPNAHEDHIPEPYAFYYEVYEDGRGDTDPLRQRYRVSGLPMRRAGNVDWSLTLERISEESDRHDHSQYAGDES